MAYLYRSFPPPTNARHCGLDRSVEPPGARDPLPAAARQSLEIRALNSWQCPVQAARFWKTNIQLSPYNSGASAPRTKSVARRSVTPAAATDNLQGSFHDRSAFE